MQILHKKMSKFPGPSQANWHESTPYTDEKQKTQAGERIPELSLSFFFFVSFNPSHTM